MMNIWVQFAHQKKIWNPILKIQIPYLYKLFHCNSKYWNVSPVKYTDLDKRDTLYIIHIL